VFTARHTRNADNAIEEAQKVLEISTEWAKSFQFVANKLLTINVPPRSAQLATILDKVFPNETNGTDRQKKNRDGVVALVRGVYDNERNAGGYGGVRTTLLPNTLTIIVKARQMSVRLPQ
jgi:hypothetical protein